MSNTSHPIASAGMDSTRAGAPTITSKLLRPPDAAEYLAISGRSLWSLTSPRGPIPAVRIGRAVRYDPADLAAYIARQRAGGAA